METFPALLAICAGNSPVPGEFHTKGQWRGALMFSLICARINSWVNNGEAGDLRRHRDHYDVIVSNYFTSGIIAGSDGYSQIGSKPFVVKIWLKHPASAVQGLIKMHKLSITKQNT